MDTEGEAIQSQSSELLAIENNGTLDPSTNKEKHISKTPDPEKESLHLPNESNENEQDETATAAQNSTTLLEIFSTFAKRIISFVSSDQEQQGQQQPISNRLNALSAFLTLACVILLCFYIVRSQTTELSMPSSSNKGSNNDNYYRSIFSAFPLPTSMEEKGLSYTWNSILQLFESNKDKSRLYIQVGRNRPKHFPQPFIDFETHNNTLKILGRPSYCVKSDENTPVNVVVSETTHLHLSEMSDCYHYTQLILTQWDFPKVHHIKLHKMLIRKQEFLALSKFIDKHNETLHRVEIDECVLCQSSYCDAGLINFPAHDFQISITRRREGLDV